MAYGGTVNPPRNRKGEAGNPPPTGARASALPDAGSVGSGCRVPQQRERGEVCGAGHRSVHRGEPRTPQPATGRTHEGTAGVSCRCGRCDGDAASHADGRGEGDLRQAQGHGGDGIRGDQGGVGIPALPSARITRRRGRVDFGVHGVESEAAVCPGRGMDGSWRTRSGAREGTGATRASISGAPITDEGPRSPSETRWRTLVRATKRERSQQAACFAPLWISRSSSHEADSDRLR